MLTVLYTMLSRYAYRSILATIWGTLFHLTATVLTQFKRKDLFTTILLNIGWVLMVAGFSLVLYSRLHLLNPSVTTLRIVLICIISDAILFHGAVVITTMIGNVHLTPLLYKTYKIVSFMEVVSSAQETAIATLYIYLFVRFTKDSIREPGTRMALRLLIVAECVVISTDIVLCVLLYLKLYLPRMMIQSWISVMKLQIEFVMLNSLMKFSQRRANRLELGTWQRHEENLEAPDFVTTPANVRELEVPISSATPDQKA